MPRKPKKKCVDCTFISTQEARQVHGPKQDGCWDEKLCHRRRTYYRKRREGNEKRRAAYRQKVVGGAVVGSEVETVSLPVAERALPYANLYIWREKRKDAPLHAIGAAVFHAGSKVLEVSPIHCAGYRRRQLERYVQKDVMTYLNARYGITFFADEIRLEPVECPIAGCPLHDRLEGAALDNG